MEKVFLEEKIFYIENFISETESNKILSMDLGWNLKLDANHENIFTSYFKNKEDIEYFMSNIVSKIKSITDNQNQKFREIPMITKYLPMQEKCPCPRCAEIGWKVLPWHYENHPKCDYGSQWITLGIVLYFNDDYDGGELIFKNKPISIKPKRNTLIVFPASEEYTHAVTEVYKNERIVFTGFVYSQEYWDYLESQESKN